MVPPTFVGGFHTTPSSKVWELEMFGQELYTWKKVASLPSFDNVLINSVYKSTY